ncbi:MAG: class I SAM-dependent methyltransferase [Patescibacteria group bacterium]|nr:MAG: class I SAM-dependent methyltransferase [Patescibacteria group bacterium]
MAPTCPVCEEAAIPYVTKNTFAFWRSPSCGLLFVWPFLKTAPQEIYEEDYFAGAKGGFGYADYDADKAVLEGFFKKFLKRLETWLPPKGRLLDVGAATGHFVGLAQAAGWQAEGIDISSHSVALGKAKGLKMERATLGDLSAPAASFDALTLWDVIEHVPDPLAALDRCETLLRAGGLLVINTPDAGSGWARFMGKRWHALVPPEHVCLFTQRALERVLRARGFEIVHAEHPIKFFTLPYIASTFARWVGWKLPGAIKKILAWRIFSLVGIPLPLRDNLLIVAKKTEK